jgi:hypothetical protein
VTVTAAVKSAATTAMNSAMSTTATAAVTSCGMTTTVAAAVPTAAMAWFRHRSGRKRNGCRDSGNESYLS